MVETNPQLPGPSTPQPARATVEQPLDVLYDSAPEHLMLNRHQLQLILERIERGQRQPSLEDAIPWVGILLALLVSIIPADFEKTAGIPADTWLAAAWMGVVICSCLTVRVFWQVWKNRKFTAETAEQIVEELAKTMRSQREQRATQEVRQAQPIESTSHTEGSPSEEAE